MLEQHAITHREGALLASGNLLGYLIGALPAAAPRLRRQAALTLRLALLVNVLTLLAMCVPGAHVLWLGARLLSGVSSAFIFVFATALVLDLRQPAAATALFSSVGIGIAATGLLVPAIYGRWPSWSSGWFACTALGALLSCAAAMMVSHAQREAIAQAAASYAEASRVTFWPVAIAYGTGGFSYIVPATFLVVILAAHPALARYASGSWVIVGIVASLSMVLWSRVAARYGKAPALVGALTLLAAGCAGPVLAQNAFGALIGAFGLGATFMAVSMLTIGIVRDLEPQHGSTRIAQATAIFGVGQVLGPLFSAYSYQQSGSYNDALLVAAGALLLAAVVVAFEIIRLNRRRS
jgi:predicted MFS family arabinose efflux permease